MRPIEHSRRGPHEIGFVSVKNKICLHFHADPNYIATETQKHRKISVLLCLCGNIKPRLYKFNQRWNADLL